ncbi:MAG: DUF1302 family protein [Rhodoferax sp.]
MKSIHKALAYSVIGAASLPTLAADFKLGDGIEGKFNATLTLGTQIRAESPHPDAYATTPSAFVPGAAPGKLSGQTGGSDLNFNKGDTISTVAKGAFDLDLKKNNIGVFVRANLWSDLTQGKNSVPYGNYSNKFAANSALSDSGFADSAKFNNAEFREYYGYGKFELGEGKSVDAKVGRQVLNWGGAQLLGGGINAAINPSDFASQVRAGALPIDGKLPLGMVSAKLVTGSDWSMEGFLPYESRSAVLPGCGTFFDIASAFPQGCNMAAILTPPLLPLAASSEAAQLVSGLYLHRGADVNASDAGQFGLSAGFRSTALDAEFKAYAMNTHSSMLGVRITVENIGGGYATGPTAGAAIAQRLSDVNGLKYANVYAENNQLVGLSGSKKLSPTTSVYGEVAYRPNAPIGLNSADVVAAFATRSPTSFLALKKGILNIAPGGTFDAYDRFGIVTANLGGSKVFPKTLGAERVVLVGEVGVSHVNDLPDQNTMRYGRPLAYGTAANSGGAACSDTVVGKTCTNDGFVTSDAWGLRVLASATYPNALAGASVTPSLLLALDVDGYSYDGTFSKGRHTIRPGVRFDWGKSYYLDLQYTLFSGGNYNLTMDRSYLSLVAGARF